MFVHGCFYDTVSVAQILLKLFITIWIMNNLFKWNKLSWNGLMVVPILSVSCVGLWMGAIAGPRPLGTTGSMPDAAPSTGWCASFCSSNVLTSLSQFPPSRYCSTCHFPFTVSGKRISGGKWADRCRHLCQLLVATWSSEPAMDGTVLMNAICYLNIYFVGWHIVLVLCCSFLFLHC